MKATGAGFGPVTIHSIRQRFRILSPQLPGNAYLILNRQSLAALQFLMPQLLDFSVSALHDGTWTAAPICYLEDLFVDPRCRGQGCGRLLIQDLINRAKSQGWSRLYWHTRSDNPARRLYDEFALADDFVRYRLIFD